jgi:putative transposase
MTVMTDAVDTSAVAKKKTPASTPEGVDAELVGRLVEHARAAGLQLTGGGGLLQQPTKWVIEAALDGEITDHLGYEKHDPAGKDGGNSRNGARAKTVLTDVGPVEITIWPRSGYLLSPPTTCAEVDQASWLRARASTSSAVSALEGW